MLLRAVARSENPGGLVVLGGDNVPPPLCAQMDFTWTFDANTKCNNIDHVFEVFMLLSTNVCIKDIASGLYMIHKNY